MIPAMTAGSTRPREQVANSVTHAAGALLAIAGLVVLVTAAALHGSARHVVGCAVFGGALVALYTASTLYHSIPHPRVRPVLQVVDHSAIYVLIAGTYTPFTLVTLRGPWGWSLFGVVWGAALAGIALRATVGRRAQVLRVLLYIVMGWVGLVAFRPLVATLAPAGVALVVGGGVVYTLGVAFYATDRRAYHHAIWHLFVLAGSVLHFLAVLIYVIPWHS
jgi:hemolysin III